MANTAKAKDVDRYAVERDYRGGMKYKDLAEKYSVTINTIKSWKQRYRWESTHTKKDAHTQRKSAHTNAKEDAQTEVNNQLIRSVETNPELTDQQREFCLHYIKTFNATASYQRAYRCDYNTANAHGYELLSDVVIRSEITRLKVIRSQAMLAGADDIVERYMLIAFSDMTDFLSWGRTVVPVMGPFGPITAKNPATGKKEVVTKEVNDVRLKESSEVDGTLVTEIKQGKDGTSIKMADRMKALEWLAGFFELNPMDKHRVEYDAKKLELDRDRLELDRKAEAAKSQIDEFDQGDDGFMDALNGKAAEAWSSSESESDAPSKEDKIQDVSASGGKAGEK